MLYFGHIASFITDQNKNIITSTVCSYRRNPQFPLDFMLEFKFPDDGAPTRYRRCYKGIHLTLEQEFNQHLFSYAVQGAPIHETGRRYLNVVPIRHLNVSIVDISTRLEEMRKSNVLYIPFQGKQLPFVTFDTLTVDQQVDYTLDNPYSHTAQEAFYRALGLMRMGEAFYADAVFSFMISLNLSPSEVFSWQCLHQILCVYKAWGYESDVIKKKLEADYALVTEISDSDPYKSNEFSEMARRFSPF